MKVLGGIGCVIVAIGCMYLGGYLLGPAPQTWYNAVNFVIVIFLFVATFVGAMSCFKDLG